MTPPFAVGLEANVSVGDVLTMAFCIAVAVYLWQKGKRDYLLQAIERGIESLQVISGQHDERIRLVEGATIQLTAIQDSMKEHLDAIDRRHERADERKAV
jgi:hypothetical protein